MMVIRTLFTVEYVRQWRPHRSVALVLLGSLLGAAAMMSPGANAAPRDTAVLPPPALSSAPRPLPVDVPTVLSTNDVGLYQRAARAQATGDWSLADRLVGELRDQRLLGYILAERYLSPRFKPSYGELTVWLRAYADLVDAPRIHALAVKLRPPHTPAPPAPAAPPAMTGGGNVAEDAGWRTGSSAAHASAKSAGAQSSAAKPAKGAAKPSALPVRGARSEPPG